ncbi:MAG: glycosyltransferase [Pseudomonadota bacterium]
MEILDYLTGISMTAVLAIAAPEFTSPSVTFIREHVRLIAPGRTVLVGRTREDLSSLGCPALDGIDPPQRRGRSLLPGRVDKMIGHMRRIIYGPMKLSIPRSDATRVARFLNAQGVEAMLVEFLTEGVALMEAAARAGVRLYPHAHAFDATSVPQSDPRWGTAFRELFAGSTGVMAPSQYIANRVEALGCPSEKVLVTPCGIDPDRFTETTREVGRVVAVGRLVEKKAPHLTIAAFAKAVKRHPQARLELIGDGPLRSRCEVLARRLGVAERVLFRGPQPNSEVQAAMRRASVFMQHSVVAPNGDTEGLPVSILEAMACAIPVVATYHSGIPEAVLDGITGLLVAEHDVDAMGHAISALLNDPSRAMTMGLAGRNRAISEFTLARTIKRLREAMNVT